MNNRHIVPNKMLKDLGDDRSLKLSNRLRAHRNRIRLFLLSLFNNKEDIFKNTHVERLTYTCDQTTTLPGRLLFDDNKGTIPSGSNKSADNAHANMLIVINFYEQMFGRVSYDNNAAALISSVNYDKEYNNAYWQGSQFCFGDGDGQLFHNFSDDLGVVAHEATHAVSGSMCNLYYYFQSGALNESLSDIFGITCRHWHEKQSDPRTANWLIGDKCVGPTFPGHALRTFIPNEKAYTMDSQPSHMKDFSYTFSDNFGVHQNSKITNIIFYRICQNLNEPSYGKPIQIMYRVMGTLKSHSGFNDFGKATIQAAKDLYNNSDITAKVIKAVKDTGL